MAACMASDCGQASSAQLQCRPLPSLLAWLLTADSIVCSAPLSTSAIAACMASDCGQASSAQLQFGPLPWLLAWLLTADKHRLLSFNVALCHRCLHGF